MNNGILAPCPLLVVALFLASALWVGERTPGQEKKAVAYNTPQEAFMAALTAAEREDWKGIYECLTDDSRELFASYAAIFGFLAKELSNPDILTDELKAALKSLQDVFKRHGLTDDHMNKFIRIESGAPKPRSLEERKKEEQEMLKPVKDRGAFIADTLAAMRKLKALKEGLLREAELKDVKVSGDSATGVMVYKVVGKEQRLAIGFRRIMGSWKVDLPEEFFFGPPMPKAPGE
jgi:hypothetical protein